MGNILALLFGAALVFSGWQSYRVSNLTEKADALQARLTIADDNFTTCKGTNAVNAATIARQRDSIRQFMLAQEEALARNTVLAEELAARQLADNEASREVRNEVSEILSAEACAAVEHPARVHRLLNDAIAKASAGGGGGG